MGAFLVYVLTADAGVQGIDVERSTELMVSILRYFAKEHTLGHKIFAAVRGITLTLDTPLVAFATGLSARWKAAAPRSRCSSSARPSRGRTRRSCRRRR